MKTHLVYASAIVISAFVLGFFYALAHHYQRVPWNYNCGKLTYRTISTWSGDTVRYAPPPGTDSVSRP